MASGVANLPYINILKFVSGIDGSTSNSTSTSVNPMATYCLVGLWNPHQQTTPTVTRPNVRLYVQGTLTLETGWATTYPFITGSSVERGQSYTIPSNTYVQLNNTAGVGVNGFLNPFAITAGDVASSSSTYSGGSVGWTSSSSALTYQSVPGTYADSGVTYEALRFPNLNITLAQTGNGIPGNSLGQPESTSLGQVHFGYLLGAQTSNQATAFQMIMKYQDPSDASGNTWVPYDYWQGDSSNQTWSPQLGLSGPTIAPAYSGSGSAATVTGPPYTPVPTVDQTLHSSGPGTLRYHSGTFFNGDPRCTRFSIFPMSGDDASGTFGSVVYQMIDSIWSGSANTTYIAPYNICGYGGGGSGGTATPGLPTQLNNVPSSFVNWYLPAYLSRNNTSYPNVVGGATGSYFTAYQDTDGIQRIADSGLFPTPATVAAAPTSGNPYYDPNDIATISAGQRTGDRPIVLNRPLASVGELGYANRDYPWRSLDFFSVFNLSGTTVSTTADSGLLDLFTVTDSANSVVAGRVNLNTKNPLVLQAILNNTLADPVGGSQTLSTTAATTIPTQLTTFTQTTPFVNKDQLVTKFNPTLTAAAFSNADEQNVKAFREAYIRSLADVGQTRTWNLMIDLVAQSGKYPPTATALDQFEVDGERHYWLHVAIDRFTGKIIDRQLELIDQ